MSAERLECQSYDQKSLVCKSGFVQKSICSGHEVKCFSCGRASESSAPWCVADDLPDHFVDMANFAMKNATSLGDT